MRKFVYAAVFALVFLFSIDFFLPKQQIMAFIVNKLNIGTLKVDKNSQSATLVISGKNLSLEFAKYDVRSFLYFINLRFKYILIEPISVVKFENVVISNTVFSPAVFDINAKSNFGIVTGNVNVLSRKVHLEIEANSEFEPLKAIFSMFLKTELIKTKKGYSVDLSY